MEVGAMPLFEVLLLRDDEDDETRLTDRKLAIGETLEIGKERWQVQRETPAERADAALRYVCVRADANE
jgi:hypothetical protein